jgi:hypothetical protein
MWLWAGDQVVPANNWTCIVNATALTLFATLA